MPVDVPGQPSSAGSPDVDPDGGSPRFVVWGDNTLALRLVGELTNRYHGRVTVIVPSADGDQAPEIGALQPANGDPTRIPVVVVAPRLSQEAFRRAGLAEAAAVALLDRDDVANVDAALIAHEVNPTVRIVLRLFNPILGENITTMLGDCTVLSGSEIAAPAFAAAVLGDNEPTYIRLPDGYLTVGARTEMENTHPGNIICGLAVTEGRDEPETLPADEATADLVLVRAFREIPARPVRRRSSSLWWGRSLLGPRLLLTLAGAVLLLTIGTIILSEVLRIDLWRATYLTILTALGGANIDLGVPVIEQVTEVVLVILGLTLVPVLTGLVVEAVVSAKLARAAGGLTTPVSGHVIVVGLGNVGARVIRELHDLGLEIVAVDHRPDARGVAVARELGIPVIIGSANSTQTLRLASVETCQTLVVLSTDDVANLETALIARALHASHHSTVAPDTSTPPRLRVVLRLFDEDFAQRVKHAFDIDTSRSLSSLAAPVFAAAMMGREVIGTIPVDRTMLLVARLCIGAGSALEGRYCPEVNRPHESRLLAVRGRHGHTLWSVPERRALVRTEQILVVATRAGLASLLRATTGVANPPPLPEPQALPLLRQYGRPRAGHDRLSPPPPVNH